MCPAANRERDLAASCCQDSDSYVTRALTQHDDLGTEVDSGIPNAAKSSVSRLERGAGGRIPIEEAKYPACSDHEGF